MWQQGFPAPPWPNVVLGETAQKACGSVRLTQNLVPWLPAQVLTPRGHVLALRTSRPTQPGAEVSQSDGVRWWCRRPGHDCQ